MNPATIAQEIHDDLGNPTDLNVSAIEAWLSVNSGKLSTLLYTDIIVENSEFVPELNNKQKDIYKEMYFIRYYKRKVQTSLGANGVEWTLVREGDSMVRRTSKTEIAKEYKALVKEHIDSLKTLVAAYHKGNFDPEGIDLI